MTQFLINPNLFYLDLFNLNIINFFYQESVPQPHSHSKTGVKEIKLSKFVIDLAELRRQREKDGKKLFSEYIQHTVPYVLHKKVKVQKRPVLW